MRNIAPKDAAELDAVETREWLDSLDYVLHSGGPAKVARLLRELTIHAADSQGRFNERAQERRRPERPPNRLPGGIVPRPVIHANGAAAAAISLPSAPRMSARWVLGLPVDTVRREASETAPFQPHIWQRVGRFPTHA